MSKSRFIVVTPNYNMGIYLSGTIESVLKNLSPGDEYWIIDGDSRDNSLAVIQTYEDRLTGWISEPDRSYADAIAKGFERSSCAYMCWINSGDLLLAGALDKARELLDKSGADFIFGDDLYIDDTDEVIQVTNGCTKHLGAMMLYGGWTPLQDACFWRRALYEKSGGINPVKRYAADYDLFLRMSQLGICLYVPFIFGAFRKHTNQMSKSNSDEYDIERERCRQDVLKLKQRVRLCKYINRFWFYNFARVRARLLNRNRRMGGLVGRYVQDICCQSTRSYFKLKNIIKALWSWTNLFVDPRKFVGLMNFPRYISDWRKFQAGYRGRLSIVDSRPCLGDRTVSTPFDPHYFYQGAWLSRKINQNKPDVHIDVGSSVATMGVISGQVPVVFIDYRPLKVSLSGMYSVAGSINTLPFATSSIKSLSCMHVLEHIGLGRYGDPIDPNGTKKAINELSRVLAVDGRLYLTVPVGRERICFNAHKIFTPTSIIRQFSELKLIEFSWVDDDALLHLDVNMCAANEASYSCGLFVLTK